MEGIKRTRSRVMILGENSMTARALEKGLGKDFDLVWSCNNRDISLCGYASIYGGRELDILSPALHDAINQFQPDIIINTAGIVGSDLCDVAPQKAITSNITGAFLVAKICKDLDLKLVHFSTTAIYDPKDYCLQKFITEETKKDPQTMYGITKYAGELAVKNVMSPDKLLIIRPCFVYGGEFDYHSALTKAIKSALTGESYNIMLDPENRKDYIHVEDEVNAVRFLLYLGVSGEFNISFGASRKFSEYVKIVEKIAVGRVYFNYFPKADYLRDHIVDNSKLRSLDWRPTISLEEGIVKVINEIEENT